MDSMNNIPDCTLLAFALAQDDQAAEQRSRLKMIEDILGDDYDLDHLRELVEAERDGRVAVAPCKCGQYVYTTDYGPVTAWRVWKIDYTDNFVVAQNPGHESVSFEFADFGKTVFLNPEEAEAALDKMKED